MTEFAWTDELNDVAIREELDRRHPERIKMRGTDVAGLQQAFSVVEEIWAPTIGRARRLPPPILHERVNGEYPPSKPFVICCSPGMPGSRTWFCAGRMATTIGPSRPTCPPMQATV